MHHQTLVRVRQQPHAIVAALIAVLLIIAGSIVLGSSAARADVPNPPAASAFNAPLCEGATTNDPTAASGPVTDLTGVFGKRLTDYNAGLVVHLYGSTGVNGGAPSCATRHVDGVGAVSTWMYCTDHTSLPCATTLADGSLSGASSLQPVSGNSRLTTNQQRIVTYIINNDLSLPTAYKTATMASNATSDSMSARQLLVWCVSDPTEEIVAGFCAANMNATRQAQLLALSQTTSELDFAVDGNSEVDAGQTVRVDVTTNIYGLPIELDTAGATVTVCGGTATLTGDALTVTGSGAASTITLCVTSSTAGSVELTGAVAAPNGLDQITWVQSTSSNVAPCQVFAAYQTHGTSNVNASASMRFRATETTPSTGGFTVAKQLAGDSAGKVPAGTEFTVQYTVDDGASVALTVTAGGDPVAVSGLDEDDVVTFEEVDLPEIDGVTWGTPAFTVDGETSSTLTISADETATIVLTNTAEETTTTPAPTPIPTDTATTSPIPAPSTSASGTAGTSGSGSLAVTGGAIANWLMPTAMVALLGGIVLLALRRRQKELAEK